MFSMSASSAMLGFSMTTSSSWHINKEIFPFFHFPKTFLAERKMDIYFCPFLNRPDTFGFLKNEKTEKTTCDHNALICFFGNLFCYCNFFIKKVVKVILF